MSVHSSLCETVTPHGCWGTFAQVLNINVAPDVAMTETALGACLSTCVLLNVIKIVGNDVRQLFGKHFIV